MASQLQHILSNSLKAEMLANINSNPKEFETLVKLAVGNTQPFSWRAAWLLSNCMEKNDRRIQPHIHTIIEVLTQVPDGQKRDLINVLRNMSIEENLEGMVYDMCITFWCQLDKIPSVRWCALRLAIKIVKKHPELYEEVKLLTTDEYLEPLSPGIKHSIVKTLKSLKSIAEGAKSTTKIDCSLTQ